MSSGLEAEGEAAGRIVELHRGDPDIEDTPSTRPAVGAAMASIGGDWAVRRPPLSHERSRRRSPKDRGRWR
jgi:hypothetical protein